jgi:hypothetical protein
MCEPRELSGGSFSASIFFPEPDGKLFRVGSAHFLFQTAPEMSHSDFLQLLCELLGREEAATTLET